MRLWGQRLAGAVSIPVYFWDEGLTSMDAEALLRDTDQDIPERIDAHAAAVTLQSFLDALRDYGAEWPEKVEAIEE